MIPLAERYRDRLPFTDATPVVSLGEGSTPLLPAPRLSERLGVELWLKWEGSNPTGSFKDRGMTVAVSKAVEEGAAAVVCASTGNTAASAATYAARAGIAAVILQPAGAVARGKIAQAQAVGARLLEVQGPFEAALDAARELGRRGHARARQLPQPVPPRGSEDGRLRDRRGAGRRAGRPRPAVRRRREHARLRARLRRVRRRPAAVPRRRGDGARVHDGDRDPHRRARPPGRGGGGVARSGGAVVPLADEEILAAWRDLARLEGVFCEPSSAAGVAAVARERPDAGARVVCVITGHGLKDPEAAARLSTPPIQVPPDPDAIAEAAS